MIKYIVLSFILLFPVNAQATHYKEVPVKYTGREAQRVDFTNNYVAGKPASYLGGPSSNNSLGGAFQFKVNRTRHVDVLLASARIRADFVPRGEIGSFDFKYKLYSGTINSSRYGIIPDINKLTKEVNMHVETKNRTVVFPDGTSYTFNEDGTYQDVPLPFDVKLKKGTYWLAREREIGQSGPVVDELSADLATVHNPEPASVFLLGGGLLAAVLRRNRKNKNSKIL